MQVDPIFAVKAVPPAALALPFATESALAKNKSSDGEQPRTREWQQQPAGTKGKGAKIEGPPQPLRAHIGGFDRMPSRAEREADAARPQSAATPSAGNGILPKASSSKAALLQQQLAQGNNTDVTQAINQHQVTQEKRAEKIEKNEARKEKQRLKNKEKAEKKEEERKAKLEKQRKEAEEENQKWLQRKVDQAAANKARFEQERQEAEKSRAATASSWRRGEDEPLPAFQARPAPGGILKKPGAGPGRSPPLDAQKAPDTSPPQQQKVSNGSGVPADFQLGSRGGSTGDRDADWRGNGAGPTSKPRGASNDHPSRASSGMPNEGAEMGALAFLNSNFMQQPAPPRQQPSASIPSQASDFGAGLPSTGDGKSREDKVVGRHDMQMPSSFGPSRRKQRPSQPQQGMFQGSAGAPENVAPSVANFFASLQGSGGAPAPAPAPAPVAPPQHAQLSNQTMGGGSTIAVGGGNSGMAPSVASFFASAAAAPAAKSAAPPAPADSTRTSMAPSVANLFAMAEGKAVAQPTISTLGPGGIPFGR